MAEYLVFRPEGLNDLPVEGNQVLAPDLLLSLVAQAYDFITSEPGPNLARRRELAPGWLGWWIEFLRQVPDLPGRIVDFTEVSGLAVTGVAFMATGEMTPGQRKFLEEAKVYSPKLAVGLEGDGYFSRHPDRRRPCLPRVIRQSMIATLGYHVFDIPDLPEGVDEATHYDQVYVQTQAPCFFYTAGDPDEERKIRRPGAIALPEYPVPHATQMTGKLMPDVPIWYLLQEVDRLRDRQCSKK